MSLNVNTFTTSKSIRSENLPNQSIESKPGSGKSSCFIEVFNLFVDPSNYVSKEINLAGIIRTFSYQSLAMFSNCPQRYRSSAEQMTLLRNELRVGSKLIVLLLNVYI